MVSRRGGRNRTPFRATKQTIDVGSSSIVPSAISTVMEISGVHTALCKSAAGNIPPSLPPSEVYLQAEGISPEPLLHADSAFGHEGDVDRLQSSRAVIQSAGYNPRKGSEQLPRINKEIPPVQPTEVATLVPRFVQHSTVGADGTFSSRSHAQVAGGGPSSGLTVESRTPKWRRLLLVSMVSRS